jgi:hypothetical protein
MAADSTPSGFQAVGDMHDELVMARDLLDYGDDLGTCGAQMLRAIAIESVCQ